MWLDVYRNPLNREDIRGEFARGDNRKIRRSDRSGAIFDGKILEVWGPSSIYVTSRYARTSRAEAHCTIMECLQFII